ncbi:hypothetical protein, partial [Neotabrizicola sp. VNH66]|uniref:hypothetical protein n=1 Tax=Neotabrizicola sp. VNH66 TaxID=3400918 RepID=UPI003C05C95D
DPHRHHEQIQRPRHRRDHSRSLNAERERVTLASIRLTQQRRAEAWKGYYEATTARDKERNMALALKADERAIQLYTSAGVMKGNPLSPATYGEKGDLTGSEPDGLSYLADLAMRFLNSPYRTGTKETDEELFGTAPEEPSTAEEGAASDTPYADLFADMGEYDGELPPEPEPTPPVPPAPFSGIRLRRRPRPES